MFRHEIGFDVELASTPQRVELGGVSLNIRQFGEAPLADILVIRPSIGASQHFADLNWRFISADWHVYFFLPEEGIVVGSRRDYWANAPLLAGAGAERWIYEPNMIYKIEDGHSSPSAGKLDFDGVRVIGIRAKVVGTARRSFRVPIVLTAPEPRRSDNYYIAKENKVAPNVFFETFRDQRPDPRTAGPDELGAWMRIVSTQYLDRWIERDLAQFAYRNTPTLLRLPGQRNPPWGRAIALGAPEPERERVIAALGSVTWLPAVLAQRGWIEPAREELLQQWRAGHERSDEFFRAIISLEDPETYPELLNHVRKGHFKPDLYKCLRELPGIEPGLTKAIDDWCDQVREKGAYPAFIIPAMHGNRDAMALLVERVREKFVDYKSESFGELFAGIPASGKREAWVKSFDPSEWTWDAIAKRWVKEDQKNS